MAEGKTSTNEQTHKNQHKKQTKLMSSIILLSSVDLNETTLPWLN